MKKTEWKEFIKNKYILLDGATGSNLMKAGMPIGVCPEQWILEHPDALIRLQNAYIDAGSNIIYAPTFTANRTKLNEYGLAHRQKEMIHELVAISKQAAHGRALIAGDISMTGRQLEPIGTMPLEELIDIYKEQIIYMEEAGVDLLIIETMMSLAEARAALIAANEVSQLPVLVTMSFEANGKTLFGTDAVTAALVLESLGADALGVNCSTGPSDMAKIIRQMAEAVSVPLIAKPNAGLPLASENGITEYDMSAETFAVQVQDLIAEGAVILGGCCGTDPSYIDALRQTVKDKTPSAAVNVKNDRTHYSLTNERKAFTFTREEPAFIGKIYASEREDLQDDLKDECFDTLIEMAEEWMDEDAEILEINLDMDGIDVKSMMIRALDELQMSVSLPLAFSSSDPEVLEGVLRHYPGRAMVRPVSEDESLKEAILEVAAKYGAVYLA